LGKVPKSSGLLAHILSYCRVFPPPPQAFFIQDLSDWTTTISKASSLLQKDKEKEKNSRNTGKTGQVLTENQRIGRELYLFAEWHERKSLVSQIYVNVGMACLGIRRLLQVFYKSLAILHL
jgi:hypothetical protein